MCFKPVRVVMQSCVLLGAFMLLLSMQTFTCNLHSQKGTEKGYRSAIFESMPNLKSLDDKKPISTSEDGLSSHSSLFVLSEAGMERDWQLVNEGIKGGAGVGGLDELTEDVDRERTARPTTAPLTRRFII